jgi:EmrB/QacA subfamily drug resistance transporter
VSGEARVGRHGPVPVIAAVSLALVTAVIDYYALTVALPTMAEDFGVRAAALHWVITAYLLAFASLTIIGGRLGDAFGRRRVLILGVSIFGVASAAAGLAPSEEVVVAFRAVQGAGAALLFPVGLAALAGAFGAARRAWAVGIVMGVTSIGTAVGPFVGGALTQALDWRFVFLVNVPVCIAAVVMARYALEESREEGATKRVDPAGCVLLSAGLVTLTIAIDQWGDLEAGPLVALFMAAWLLLWAFVGVERRTDAPLVDLRILRAPGFRAILAAGCMGNVGWAIAVFATTLYLQRVEDLNALEAGSAFLIMSAGSAIGGPAAGRLVPRVGARAVLVVSLALGALSLLWLSAGWPAYSFLPALFFTGLFTGTMYSATNIGTMAAAPPTRTGEVSGITLTALMTAAAVAVTIGGSVITSAPQGETADAIGDGLRLGVVVTMAGAAIMLAAARWLPSRAATTTGRESA